MGREGSQEPKEGRVTPPTRGTYAHVGANYKNQVGRTAQHTGRGSPPPTSPVPPPSAAETKQNRKKKKKSSTRRLSNDNSKVYWQIQNNHNFKINSQRNNEPTEQTKSQSIKGRNLNPNKITKQRNWINEIVNANLTKKQICNEIAILRQSRKQNK